jgi:hypothetical protein
VYLFNNFSIINANKVKKIVNFSAALRGLLSKQCLKKSKEVKIEYYLIIKAIVGAIILSSKISS